MLYILCQVLTRIFPLYWCRHGHCWLWQHSNVPQIFQFEIVGRNLSMWFLVSLDIRNGDSSPMPQHRKYDGCFRLWLLHSASVLKFRPQNVGLNFTYLLSFFSRCCGVFSTVLCRWRRVLLYNECTFYGPCAFYISTRNRKYWILLS